MGDFSLNAANAMSAEELLQRGLERLAPTHDLNAVAELARRMPADSGYRSGSRISTCRCLTRSTACSAGSFDRTSYKDCDGPVRSEIAVKDSKAGRIRGRRCRMPQCPARKRRRQALIWHSGWRRASSISGSSLCTNRVMRRAIARCPTMLMVVKGEQLHRRLKRCAAALRKVALFTASSPRCCLCFNSGHETVAFGILPLSVIALRAQAEGQYRVRRCGSFSTTERLRFGGLLNSKNPNLNSELTRKEN